MKPRAIYALSADPIHFGHLDIIERASQHFSLTVLVANDPKKKYLFSLEKRRWLVSSTIDPKWNVQIAVLPEGVLTVDYAYENHIPVIIRGIRNPADYDYEKMLRDVNISQQAGIETYFLNCNPKFSHVSSTATKELFKYAGFIHEYVPLTVKKELERQNGVIIIGVTGNIASGKNWFCDFLLRECNTEMHHIDVDKVAHFILSESNAPVHHSIRQQIRTRFDLIVPNEPVSYGSETLSEMEIKILGNIVFGDPKDREDLNRIMYNPVLTEIRRHLRGKKGIILINSALLVEFGMTHICNNDVVLITTSDEIRIQRMKERGYCNTQIRHRLASQYTDLRKEELLLEQIQEDGCGKIFTYFNGAQNKYPIDPVELLGQFYKTFDL